MHVLSLTNMTSSYDYLTYYLMISYAYPRPRNFLTLHCHISQFIALIVIEAAPQFIKNHILRSNFKIISHPFAEAVTLTIHSPSCDFTLVSIYCSPRTNLAEFSTFFMRLLSIPGPIVITGDFNARNAAWNDVINNARGVQLLKLCNDKNYLIHPPDGPTTVPSDGPPSTIDFAISKLMIGISNPSVLKELSSDHYPISFSISSQLTPPKEVLPNFKKANWRKYKSIVKEEVCELNSRFPNLSSAESVDSLTENFNVSIDKALNVAVPLRKPYVHLHKYSETLKALTKERRRIRKAYDRSYDPTYKSLISQLNLLIKHESNRIK